MKKTILVFALAISSTVLFAQKKITTSATISFDATTEKDDIAKAENKASVASLDTKKGTIAFETTIKNFSFANPMVQDHFNGAKWLDSDKFATATFKGAIKNIDAINFDKDGSYIADVEGDLSMHGETNPVKTKATLVIKDKVINASTAFTVKLSDYKVEVGSNASGKVSQEPKISVVAVFK